MRFHGAGSMGFTEFQFLRGALLQTVGVRSRPYGITGWQIAKPTSSAKEVFPHRAVWRKRCHASQITFSPQRNGLRSVA